jgi:Transposase DDE domain
VPAGRKKKAALEERALARWKLIGEFQARLDVLSGEARGTFADPRRKLSQGDYLSLLLFGLFNPVVESMRGLCAASNLRRVQEEICSHPVSLGSFSEAQAVVEPELLQKVFHGLAAEEHLFRGDRRLERYRKELLATDGTLWAALPRMTWAIWRWQHGRESALKVHVKFNILEQKPVAAVMTPAKRCERAVLREHLQPGEFYVADRYYGEDYKLFSELGAAGCSFVLRLRQEATFQVLQEFALSEQDRDAGVIFDGWCAWVATHSGHQFGWCASKPWKRNFCW